MSCGGRGSLAPRNTSATEAAPNEVFDVRSLFPGVATPEEIERQRSKLADVLQAEGLEAADESYTVLQYNSPFTIPWRRRNELVVALKASKPLVRRKARGDRGPAPPAMPRAAWSGSPFPTRGAPAAAPPASDPSGSYLESL